MNEAWVQLGLMFAAAIVGGLSGFFSSHFLAAKQERASIRKHWLYRMTEDVADYLALLESLSHEIHSQGKTKDLLRKEVLERLQRFYCTQYKIALRLDFTNQKHVEFYQPILDLQEVVKQVETHDEVNQLREQFNLSKAAVIENTQQLFAVEREKIKKLD